MASEKFIKAEAGKQTLFGTAVTTTFKLPFIGEYEDGQEEHSAEYDSGTWTPTTIVEKVAEYATFSLNGTAFFELLPVLFNAGFDHMTGSGSNPVAYTDTVSPTAVGTPRPYTFLFGGSENIGGTGPAIRVQDAFCQSITLSGNINTKEVQQQSTWFGLSVNDNSAAGFAFANSNLPASIQLMNTLRGGLSLKDAAATGGSFSSMTALDGVLMDWTLTINTGLEPRWRSDGNQITYDGVQYVPPSVQFQPVIETDSTTYGLIRTKFNARTYQELQLVVNGLSSRSATFNLTGRWTAVPRHTGRANGRMVLQPTFTAETPHTQTTTPHWFGWTFNTQWSH